MTKTKAQWIIDKQITRNTTNENLEEVIRDLGYDVKVVEYIPFKSALDYYDPLEFKFKPQNCIILYGTVELVRKLQYFGKFLNEERLLFSNYFADLQLSPTDYLNDDFVMASFYDFRNNFDKYAELFGTDALFIRPNSGAKLFTGMSVDSNNIAHEINCMQQLSGVTDRSLIVVAKQKKIYDEVRFVVVGDRVIDGSRYKTQMQMVQDKKFAPELLELANKVAKCEDKPEEIFTVDIADTAQGPKIIELNSFSCAGWYGCDPKLIVTEVSNYVEQLYDEAMNQGTYG